MKINLEIDEQELKSLILEAFYKKLSGIPFNKDNVKILVKSKQNWKSEWEEAAFKATYTSL